MAHYIDKDALVAEIKRKTKNLYPRGGQGMVITKILKDHYEDLLDFIDTIEVKEVGISIPNIDDTLKEEGFDPDSKEAKVFKESYYMALEKLKAQKGEEVWK